MRFLIDADLPRSTAALLRRYNHEATDVRDIGLGGAKDREIIAYARSQGLCLLTGDFDFSNVRNYPPKQYSGIVVLRLPPDFNRFIYPEPHRDLSKKRTHRYPNHRQADHR